MATSNYSAPTIGTDQLPVTHGSLLDFADDPIACMRRLYAEHGKIAALQDGSQRVIFAFGPEYNQRILSDTTVFYSRFFGIRGPRRSAQRRLTSGILSMNGEQHRRNRRLVMTPFSLKSIQTYHSALVRLTEEMLAKWQSGEVRDIYQDMTQLMLRIASEILFGFDQKEIVYSIGRKIERWVEMNHELGIGAFLPDDRFSENYEVLMKLADELEAEILEMIHQRRANDTGACDVLSILIRAYDEQGGLSDEELIGQAALLFGAAHLTSANTLTWTLLLLAQHPEVMTDLHQELSEKLQGRSPSLEEIDQLSLMERVIKESMRVLPASSYLSRNNTEPVQLGPFELPRGTSVVFSQFITHHMSELYDDPESFRPERWLTIKPSPYEFFPFGAGPRLCLGGPLAMMVFKIALPTILQRFKITSIEGSNIDGLVTGTMLAPTDKVPMLVEGQDGHFRSHWITGNIHQMANLLRVSVGN